MRLLRLLLPLCLSATVLSARDYLRLEAGGDGMEHLQVAVRDFRLAEP